MGADDDNPAAVRRIAGHRVIATVDFVFEEGSSEEWTEPHYLLDNGAMVSTEARIGDNVTIGSGAIIEKSCEIGDNVTIEYLCRIGDQCKLGDGCSIGYRTTIDHECELGDNVVVDHESYVGPLNDLPSGSELGSYVTIAGETFGPDSERPPVHAQDSTVFVAWHTKKTVNVRRR